MTLPIAVSIAVATNTTHEIPQAPLRNDQVRYTATAMNQIMLLNRLPIFFTRALLRFADVVCAADSCCVGRGMSSLSRQSVDTSNSVAICKILSTSGSAVSVSHLPTAWRLTLSLSASSSCDQPFYLRRVTIFSDNFILVLLVLFSFV